MTFPVHSDVALLSPEGIHASEMKGGHQHAAELLEAVPFWCVLTQGA
jgi:hypothetical protein